VYDTRFRFCYDNKKQIRPPHPTVVPPLVLLPVCEPLDRIFCGLSITE
jgi:hypothetical protein